MSKKNLIHWAKNPQWAKSGKNFQGGAGPNFHHFPLKTSVDIVKHQKLGKSVGRNGDF